MLPDSAELYGYAYHVRRLFVKSVIAQTRTSAHRSRENAPQRELYLRIHQVPYDKHGLLVRREPLKMPVYIEEGYYLCDSADLEMQLWGENWQELRDVFHVMLCMCWKIYVKSDPNKLTKGALELRKNLMDTYELRPTSRWK